MVIEYDGWGAKYREKISPKSTKIAPFHTFTWEAKCWAKYENYPWWPAVVAIRVPGTTKGKRYLESESKLHVDFLDNKDLSKRTRCWLSKKNVESFSEQHESRQSEYFGKEFEFSLQNLNQSTAAAQLPKFGRGILPKNLETAQLTSVAMIRKKQGNRTWRSRYSTSRERYRLAYVFTEESGPSRGIHTWKGGMRLTKTSDKTKRNSSERKRDSQAVVRPKIGRPRLVKVAENEPEADSPVPQPEAATRRVLRPKKLAVDPQSLRLKKRMMSSESTKRGTTSQTHEQFYSLPLIRKRRKRMKPAIDSEAAAPNTDTTEKLQAENSECETTKEIQSGDPSSLWKKAILAYRQTDQHSKVSPALSVTNESTFIEPEAKSSQSEKKLPKKAKERTCKPPATALLGTSPKFQVDISSDPKKSPSDSAAGSTSEEPIRPTSFIRPRMESEEDGNAFSQSALENDRNRKNKVVFILSSRKSRSTSQNSAPWIESENVPTHCNDTKTFRLCHWFASHLNSLRTTSQRVKDNIF
nr:conserved hypothetical protein [Albugo laibachii Nc14]|eukprot:CCA23613.1 conserved hypothetical protein [Albugo laibachii Nc14]